MPVSREERERGTEEFWTCFGRRFSPFRRGSAERCGKFPRIRADRAKEVVRQEAVELLEDTSTLLTQITLQTRPLLVD